MVFLIDCKMHDKQYDSPNQAFKFVSKSPGGNDE